MAGTSPSSAGVAVAAALAVAVALALFGCDRQEPVPEAGETPPLVTADLEGGTPPERTPEWPAASDDAIPQRYHGVWDAVGGSCDPASDLRVEIAGKRILFYESVGTVTGTQRRGEDAVADLAMEGEGERWTRSLRLTLSGAGDDERLVLADALETPGGTPVPLRRCPS